MIKQKKVNKRVSKYWLFFRIKIFLVYIRDVNYTKPIMNKTLLNDKLKSYSAVAGSILATAASADAQIVYTDVNPDNVLTITNGTMNSFDVNFDGDAQVDVQIATYGYLYGAYQLNYSLSAFPTGGTWALVGTVGAYGGEATPLAASTMIDASSAWVDETAAGGTTFFNAVTVTGIGPVAGTWATGSDAYLGARFTIGANTHYGWVRMSVAADGTTTTVKDYAYKSTADSGIPAGDTGLGINEMPSNVWFVGVNGKSIVVSAKVDGALTVVDAAGRTVATGNVVNGEAIVTLEDAATGIFVVSFENEGTMGTKKVVLN